MPPVTARAATAVAVALAAASGAAAWRGRSASRQPEQPTGPEQEVATPEPVADPLIELLRRRPEVAWRHVAMPMTDLVHARLDDDAVASVEARLEGVPAELYATCDAATQRRLTLNFAAFYEVIPVLERAGLTSATPPGDIHAMARGPVAAGGDFYIADLLFDALDHAGVVVPDGGTVLDFGSSSGRILRAVAAGRPDLQCLGCDPNAGAIAWATEHLPMATFFQSPQRPPLELADGSVDLVYAVSIWSHFAEAPALEWFAEMHRVLAPGGILEITTHGIDCLSTQLRRGDVSDGTAVDAANGLLERGHHFVDVFGPEGDWGVKDTGWGNAWLSLEWLLSHTGDDWSVLLDWPGALDEVQDVIVLQRR